MSIMDEIIALIVDDSKAACAVLGRLLKRFGINSQSVHSAQEGLAYLESHTPDIIFMDHSMPDMDGLEAVEIIKEQPKFAATPIYMFTAKSGNEYQEQVAKAGANGVVSKTLELQALKQVLSQHRLMADKSTHETSDDVMQEQRMQMWLESFLENKIMPSLAYRLDHSTRETREEMLQNSQKLYRDSLSFHMQQQKQLVNQLQAEKDALAASYEWSRIQFHRRLTISLSVVLLIVCGFFATQWYSIKHFASQLESKQQSMLAQLIDLTQKQSELVKDNVEISEKITDAPKRPTQIYDQSGQPVAKIVSFSMDKSSLRARTNTGYFFNLNEGEIEAYIGPLYFAAQGCFGTRFVESEAGYIFTSSNGELMYTPDDYKPQYKDVYSMVDKEGNCVETEMSVVAVPLFANNYDITGVSDVALQVR